ncbi:MAG TPA: mechanosensitive ion channel family protein [Thermoplasmata archaeon]|nr:mechanosensitive ion channel family protein [Thermoplasmata archaeon]
MRREAFLALLFLAALLATPLASADRLGASNVTYYPAGPSQVALHIGESLDYPWVFFNGETAKVYVNLTAQGVLGFTAVASPSFAVLDIGGSGEIVLRLTAPAEGAGGSGSVTVHLMAVNLQTNAVAQQDVAVPVTLLGVPPSEDPTGKILGIWPNPLPSPLDNNGAAFGLSILIWVGIAAGLAFIIHPIVKATLRRATTKLEDVVRVLRVPVFVLTLLYGAVHSLAILGVPGEALYSIYRFPVVLILTWVGYRIFRDILLGYGRALARRMKSDIDERLIPALEKVGAVVIVVVGLVLAVQSLGFDITLVLAGFGVVGLVIAFAAQDTVSNFFAGIYIMLDRPFRVGDLIEIEPDVICTVDDIGLRTTKLYWGKNHTFIIMPNNELANRKIINYVRPNRRFRANVKVGVSYKSDLDQVKQVMLDIARAHPWVLKGNPEFEPIWRVVDFGESTIIVMIIVWVDDVDHKWHVGSELREQIKKRFNQEGIEISFPQRVIEILPGPRPSLVEGEGEDVAGRSRIRARGRPSNSPATALLGAEGRAKETRRE